MLGDFTERGETNAAAIFDMLGFLARRHTAVLLDLRLWAAVALLILPVSYLLSATAQTTSAEGSVYSWMYLNNWDWALTSNPGFWHVLRETAINFGITCLILACWSWSAGFLIGRLPSAVVRSGRNTFVVLLAAVQLVDAPALLSNLWMSLHGVPLRSSLPDAHAPITANVFYHAVFPWIVLSFLVLLPAFSGIRQGNRVLLLGRKIRLLLVTAASASLVVLLIREPGFGLLLSAQSRNWFWRHRDAMQMLPLLCCWPMLYLVVIGVARYRRRNAALA